MEKKLFIFLFACLLLISFFSNAWSDSSSEPLKEKKCKSLMEIGLLTGYGSESIDTGHYEIIPILPQFGFDINSFIEKMGMKPKGKFEFIIEPLMNVVINPDTNVEAGFSLILRYGDHITKKLKLFCEGGLGTLYTSQHTKEQGTQYEFLSQAGMGLQYFLTKKVALTGAYRFRHMSNAGASNVNSGINHDLFLVGLSMFY
jgi:hypothetical protein